MPIQFQSRPGLVIYLTAGDPSLEATRAIALEAIDAGADVIELGVPFSDPRATAPLSSAQVSAPWRTAPRSKTFSPWPKKSAPPARNPAS